MHRHKHKHRQHDGLGGIAGPGAAASGPRHRRSAALSPGAAQFPTAGPVVPSELPPLPEKKSYVGPVGAVSSSSSGVCVGASCVALGRAPSPLPQTSPPHQRASPVSNSSASSVLAPAAAVEFGIPTHPSSPPLCGSTSPTKPHISVQLPSITSPTRGNTFRPSGDLESMDLNETLSLVLNISCNATDPVVSRNEFIGPPIPWMVYELLQLIPNNLILQIVTNSAVMKQQLFTVLECPHVAGFRAIAEFCCLLATSYPLRAVTRFFVENEPLLCSCIVRNCDSERVFLAINALLVQTRYFSDTCGFSLVVLKAVLHLSLRLSQLKRSPSTHSHTSHQHKCQVGHQAVQSPLQQPQPQLDQTFSTSPPTHFSPSPSPNASPSPSPTSSPNTSPSASPPLSRPETPKAHCPYPPLSHIITLIHSSVLCFMPSDAETFSVTPEPLRTSEMSPEMLNTLLENKLVFSKLFSKAFNSELSSSLLSLICDVVLLTPPQHILFSSLFHLVLAELKSLHQRKQYQFLTSQATQSLASLTLAFLQKVDRLNVEVVKDSGDMIDVFFDCPIDSKTYPIAVQIAKCILLRLPNLQQNLAKHRESSQILADLSPKTVHFAPAPKVFQPKKLY
ncbi:hypothetical protein Pelo_3647 [Pelomyxa schiedti]|nr:hypothetical protein Pelo_3647 [Pelomyxa schiedti]